jgi:hypothetical protein
MSLEPFETAEAHDSPLVTQLSVFVDDRVGQLLKLTQLFENTAIHILGLMVVNLTDSAVVRLIVDDPDEATEVLSRARFPVTENEVLVVCVPHGKRALLELWSTVLGAEINVHYTYALMGLTHGRPVLAVHAEDPGMAYEALTRRRFVCLSQSDLLKDHRD